MRDAASNPDFASNAARNANKEGVYAAIEDALSRHSTAEVVELLDRAGVPSGPISDLAQVFADPQSVHAGMRQSMTHSKLGEIGVPGFPYQVGGESLQVRHAAPMLGEQSADILAELGYSDEEIAAISGS